MKIVYEDEEILLCEKPPGLATQPDKTGDESVLSILAQSRPDLGLVHRLDRPVGGLMVFAKSRRSLSSLSGQIADGNFQKAYLAVVMGKPGPSGVCMDYCLYTGVKTLAFQAKPLGQPPII